MLLLTTNRKSFKLFQITQKSLTLDVHDGSLNIIAAKQYVVAGRR